MSTPDVRVASGPSTLRWRAGRSALTACALFFVGLACEAQNLAYFWVTTDQEEVTVSGVGRTTFTYEVRVTNAQFADRWDLDLSAELMGPGDTDTVGSLCAPDLSDANADCAELSPGATGFAPVVVTTRCGEDGRCDRDHDVGAAWGSFFCRREVCSELASFAVDYDTDGPMSLSHSLEVEVEAPDVGCGRGDPLPGSEWAQVTLNFVSLQHFVYDESGELVPAGPPILAGDEPVDTATP